MFKKGGKKRFKMSKRSSKKSFSKFSRSRKMNEPRPMRGGIRL